MSAKSAINREIFGPRDEKMVASAQVKRRTKKKIPFLATGGLGDYRTFICVSVTNEKPAQLYITKDCPEFDLVFDGGSDQWQASSSVEKSLFIQVLHRYCQKHCKGRKPEFINCPSKLLGGTSLLQAKADGVGGAVQRASQALNERGERLGRAEEKTVDMMNSSQQLADTAQKVGGEEGGRGQGQIHR
ncbi:hypothetical protein JZ751_010414, partial [Albula glossodonta]